MSGSTPRAREARLAQELAEQARWLPRNQKSGGARSAKLVHNEFIAPELQQANVAQRLQKIISTAARDIPYYRELLAGRQLTAQHIDAPEKLVLLPTLGKDIVRAQGARLLNPSLAAGESHAGSFASSGSTGEPIRIKQTNISRFMRILLTQRQLRWYRFDPLADLCAIRGARVLPRVAGAKLAPGATLTLDNWPGCGKLFLTGRFLGFAYENSTQAKADWLERQSGYLFSTTTCLEHIAFVLQNRKNLPGVTGVRAMSEPLLPAQRARIENAFAAPLHISYGLDEIGWLATRCTEGNRYHAHTENALIEIVDAGGQPCPDGQFGRVLVTTLSNTLMPLIRYETDDIAQALSGPCPCGRTLPSFGDIIGRQSLMENLPEGTTALVSDLRSAIYRMPRELTLALREYQIRQSLDGNFQLYVIAAGRRDAGFDDRVQEQFAQAISRHAAPAGPIPTLTIFEALSIPRSPSKKFFHFVSDFSQSALAKDRVELPAA